MQKGPTTPKGFGDIFSKEAIKRRNFINAVIPVLEEYGFSPIETPTIEFAETLLGKYGEEEKLIYQFTDNGGRKLALRYDLTVPLARFIANNSGLLSPSFKRYQIGQVFRGENPQKGRKREFTQFDFDSVGSSDISEDVDVISAAIKSTRKAGLKDAIMQINDREIFDKLGFTKEQVIMIDKIEKVDRNEILKTVPNLDDLEKSPMPDRLVQIEKQLEEKGFKKDIDFIFNPYLARGLNYYTSTIFELKLDKTPKSLSVGGGGRYDKLIGMFLGRDVPAVGFSFGLDRIIDLTS